MVDLLAGVALLFVGGAVGYTLRRLEARLVQIDNEAVRDGTIKVLKAELGVLDKKLNAHEADLGMISVRLDLKRED